MSNVLKAIAIWCLMLNSSLYSVNKDFFERFCSSKTKHPFDYNLGVRLLLGSDNAHYIICFHGSGANNRIADSVRSCKVTSDHLISFNFPDHGGCGLGDDPKKTSFGTINELLPALYVLKKCVVDGGLDLINLYGFSAGGAVVVNLLAVLSNNRFTEKLNSVGITQPDIQKMLAAIQKGIVILDCPLKSIEEIADFRGHSYTLNTYAERYRLNNLRPIDSLETWRNLKLTILLYFQKPDEILSNRDDQLFASKIKQYNTGRTHVIIDNNGGHNTCHRSLWKLYQQIIKAK